MAHRDGHPGTPFDDLEHDPASWLAARIDDTIVAARAHRAMVHALDTAGPDRVLAAVREVRDAGPSEEGNPADPALRALIRAWFGAIAETAIDGAIPTGGPIVLLSNHLSYTDTTATDVALVAAGHAALADRIAVLAGPKVWDTPLHALATRALNIVPTVQSEAVGGESARAAAARLLRGVALARRRMEEGAPLLVYPEGTRSRSGRLGSFLKGVRHYLGVPGTVVVPVALQGTDRIYPIDADRLIPGPVRLAIGAPIPAEDPESALRDAWREIVRMLPERHRPSADTPPVR